VTRFCQKVYEKSSHFVSPDPIDVCRNKLHYEVVRSFLEWSCQNSKFKKASSLFTYGKTWRMAMVEPTRAPVDPAIKMDMQNMRTLVHLVFHTFHSPSNLFAVHHEHFDRPIRARRNRPIQSCPGCGRCRCHHFHHWVLNDDYSPEERQRVLLAIMGIFSAPTTACAGTIIKSSCYFGRNEAVEYGEQALLKDGRRTEALVRLHHRFAFLTVGGSS
jgi:hypothetical protein